jgi:hypothetical protein
MKVTTPPRRPPPVFQPETASPATTANAVVGLKSTDRAAREEILHRAYAIWESEGHPSDRKLANWLEAEAAVLAGR